MRQFMIVFLCFGVLLNMAWASESTTFNVKLATQQLASLKKTLTAPQTTPTAFLDAIETITDLVHQALLCTEETQKELNGIDVFIKQSKKIAETTTSADLVYLEQQQKKWSNIQAECRLFTIRATEEIDIYKHRVITLREKATLSRSMPVWILYEALQSSAHVSIEQNFAKIISNNDTLTRPYLFISLPTAFMLSLLFLISVRKTTFSARYLHYTQIKLLYVTVLTLSLNTALLLVPFIFNLNVHNETNELIRPLSLLCLYFTSWFTLIFIFKIKSVRALLDWYNLNYRFARASIFFILTAFTTAALSQWSVDMQLYSPLIWQLLKTLYLYLLLLVCFISVIYYCHTKHPHHWIKQHALGFQFSITTLLSIPMVLGTMGYLTLSLQLMYASFILLTILFFMTTFILGSEKLYRYMYDHVPLKQHIMNYLGYKSEQTFTEFLILKIAIQLIVLIFGLFLIAKATGFSTETIELAYDQFLNGIHLGNITLYPTRIILGIIVFCLLYLASRAISTKISAHQQFEDEEETQVAVASLLTYIGFSIAGVIGALIAGFDFTGLAIIAGALSVGIGLGLQSIVNNFVSGLIILIEKPIKPGDRIAIDGVEGVVKKIRVRSTQIMTNAREDIIIPNSDLITQRVVNFMLTDKYCRITFDIDVAYDSDTYLVRDTLLEIANEHDDVVKTERNKPTAFLSAFGENALIFQLTCLIKDVNKKLLIRSDINFEINRAFKERHINMPFVQREIHIRTSSLGT